MIVTLFFSVTMLSACVNFSPVTFPVEEVTDGDGTDIAVPDPTDPIDVTPTPVVSCLPGEHKEADDTCVPDLYTPVTFAEIGGTDEYNNSWNLLNPIKAAQAYANIENLIDADNNSGAITQGGEGQTVSLMNRYGFSLKHVEFYDGTVEGGQFTSIYNAEFNKTYTHDAVDMSNHILTDSVYWRNRAYFILFPGGGGNCLEDCHGNAVASIMVGRQGVGDDTLESLTMQGIAYNAKLKAIITNNDESQIVNAISAGVGPDIVAMSAVWERNTSNFTATLQPAESAAWEAAIDPTGVNKTILVFDSGKDSKNSETGGPVVGGMVREANIPNFHAAYPAIYKDDALEAGRWLAVVAVDTNNVALPTANGCGIAENFCMAAPAEKIYTARHANTTSNVLNTELLFAASAVTGALAVLKGAFPNATPEQLTSLVLETSSYLPLDDKNQDGTDFVDPDGMGRSEDEIYRTEVTNIDGTNRYINVVYGYGLLNMGEATKPSVVSSYVTAADNQSIGALWTDTKLTLSSHFGANFESVKFGIGDVYGRHFITKAPQTSYAPIAVGLDDYMGNLLGENIQSQRLGGQTQANYSNTENQRWMNLHYVSGKATTKIAFQDSYKVSPLTDIGTTTILRANHIRPASTNISMMDIDYKLGSALVLSSYLARGEYDTGYKFDELATDFDVNYKQSHLNIAIGNIREHDQFLGTNTSGAYALSAPSISRFTDITYGHDLGATGKFNIYANYINYQTDVAMDFQQFASIDGLQADQYQIGFTGKDLISKDDSLNIALITKLGVTDGALNQNSTIGYTADGAFKNVNQSYDLAVGDRHQQFEITYQGKLYQNADKVSNFRDNRFFTSIRVDSNLNHVQGASQVEIVSGINIRY